MRTTIRRASLSVLTLCTCTACASAAGGAGQPGTRVEQNARFVQVTNERHGDFVFYLPGDSVGDRPSRGLFRIPAAETGTLPSYEVTLSPPR
jgi:hypothetical protein